MKKYLIITLTVCFSISCSTNEAEKEVNQINNIFDKNIDRKNDNLFTVSTIEVDGKPFKHRQKFTNDYQIHEPLGSGVAVLDVNNDGTFEVFFPQFDKVENNKQTASVLYSVENNKFSDITKESGLDGLTSIMGVATADINNDGWEDMLIYGYQNIFMMINENGYFKKLPFPEMPQNNFYSSATFFKANNDEYLDVWISTYLDLSDSSSYSCVSADGIKSYCPPATYPFQSDYLLINDGGKGFKILDERGIIIEKSPALGVVSSDFNNDNLQDIYVANDGQENFLFIQQSDGSFKDLANSKNVNSNLSGINEASMGIAIGDYDNNGLPDIYITHYENETNTLYKNEGEWFTDVTNRTGLSATSRSPTGFGTGFYDLNGDNWLDIVVVNGRIEPKAYQKRGNLYQQFREYPLMYINDFGKFIYKDEFNSQDLLNQIGRGLAFVDIENDGDKDLISNNNNSRPLLFINNTNPIKWYGLTIKCHNRIDIGAKVDFIISENEKSQKFYRSVHTDGSYASANDPRIIIALRNDEILKAVTISFAGIKKSINVNEFKQNSYKEYSCN